VAFIAPPTRAFFSLLNLARQRESLPPPTSFAAVLQFLAIII
jgi:hypothetical protein